MTNRRENPFFFNMLFFICNCDVRTIFVWPWSETVRTKQKQQMNRNRAIWLVYWMDTEACGFRLAKQTIGWKNFIPKEISRNQSILCFDVTLQHEWPIKQCLLHIRVFLGKKTKSPCLLPYKENTDMDYLFSISVLRNKITNWKLYE